MYRLLRVLQYPYQPVLYLVGSYRYITLLACCSMSAKDDTSRELYACALIVKLGPGALARGGARKRPQAQNVRWQILFLSL